MAFVLVEGVTDRIALEAVAAKLGRDLAQRGSLRGALGVQPATCGATGPRRSGARAPAGRLGISMFDDSFVVRSTVYDCRREAATRK